MTARSRSGTTRTIGLVVSAGLLVAMLATASADAVGRNGTVTPGHASAEQPLGEMVCQDAGIWLDPASGRVLDPKEVLRQAAGGRIVLLGETHSSSEDHLWQAAVLAGLFAHHTDLITGFEAFPRRVQPVLDEWSKGAISKEAFLEKSGWDEVWGYDADDYMPLFDFARQNRLPVVALNVERALIGRVGREGWAAVPTSDREGLSDPAPASQAYLEALASVFQAKLNHGHSASGAGEQQAGDGAAQDVVAILDRPDFGRFAEAQLTWDRAMAEALARAAADNPDALVVGVLGRGHVEYGYGVPHQLADLGVSGVTSFLTARTGETCEDLVPGIADAVFLVERERPREPLPARPLLGVVIEPAGTGGLLLRGVSEGSIAEAADLREGDILLKAAGVSLGQTSDLTGIIRQQAPGTWLPLEVLRDGKTLVLVARFPPSAESRP